MQRTTKLVWKTCWTDVPKLILFSASDALTPAPPYWHKQIDLDQTIIPNFNQYFTVTRFWLKPLQTDFMPQNMSRAIPSWDKVIWRVFNSYFHGLLSCDWYMIAALLSKDFNIPNFGLKNDGTYFCTHQCVHPTGDPNTYGESFVSILRDVVHHVQPQIAMVHCVGCKQYEVQSMHVTYISWWLLNWNLFQTIFILSTAEKRQHRKSKKKHHLNAFRWHT